MSKCINTICENESHNHTQGYCVQCYNSFVHGHRKGYEKAMEEIESRDCEGCKHYKNCRIFSVFGIGYIKFSCSEWESKQ